MQSSIEEKRESICQTLKQLESRETLSQEDYELLRTWAANSNSEIRTLIVGFLAQRTEQSAGELLLTLSRDPDPAVRAYALDVLCNFPGHDGTYELLIGKLLSCHDKIAYYASLIEKFGDPRALDTLQKMIQFSDIGYVDYIELRNAIESLGGDPGEERTFYGDPDYEAMRNV